jgi:hypothetical protein
MRLDGCFVEDAKPLQEKGEIEEHPSLKRIVFKASS